jgi:Undecaprenyl-phosphate glucose phosphotransferase
MMKVLPATPHSRSESEATGNLLGRLRPSYEDFSVLAILSDVCAVVIASVATGGLYHWIALGRAESLSEFWGLGVLLAALTIVVMKLNGLYTPDGLLSIRFQIAPILLSWSGVVLLLLGASFALKISADLSRGWALSFAVAAPLLILCQRSLLRCAMLAVIQKGSLKRRKILLITSGLKPVPVADDKLCPYDVVGIQVLPQEPADICLMLRTLVSTLRGSEIKEIHLAIDWDRWSGIKYALMELRALPLPVRLIADATAREILNSPQRTLCDTVSFEVQRAPLTLGERATKRIFDILVATCVLLVMAPVLTVVSVLVWIDSPGPILFRQKRGGFNGRTFQILKFRTMHVMEDGPVIIQAARHDDRITRVGRFLRRTSVDELPQLVNVLLGQMSLVGPRPHALTHDDQYSKLISTYPRRQHVKPGITGWAQVNGFRGETPTAGFMKRRVESDLWYVSNWSLWLDVRILMQTVIEICRSRNAF